MFLRAIAMVLMFASVPAPSTSQVAPTHSPPKGFEQLQSNFPAPKTSFSDENLAGKTIDAFKGKIVVLNFWATWCTPCIAEMPALERLADRLPLAKFSVIAISQDRGGRPWSNLSWIGLVCVAYQYTLIRNVDYPEILAFCLAPKFCAIPD